MDPYGMQGYGPPPESLLAWTATLTAGLGLIARGRLVPAVSEAGYDAWRVGPYDPADRHLVGQLAAAFPASAYPEVVADRPRLALHDPAWLIVQCWDALADVLVRSPAAPLVAGTPLFAAVEPQPAEDLRSWIATADHGLEGGVAIALRLELQETLPGPEVSVDDDDGDDGEQPAGRAVVQLASQADPSLVVDAVDLFDAPAAVLARFGEQAEEELLLGLRRGSRAWPPLAPLLQQRTPSWLPLDDAMVAELVEEGAEALRSAGIEVLWPSELVKGGLALRAVVSQAPGAVTEAGFKLDSLVQVRWQVTFDGEPLSDAELDELAEAKRGLVRIRGRWVLADGELIAKAAARRARQLPVAEALAALLGGQVALDGENVPVVADGPLGTWVDKLRNLTVAQPETAAPDGLAGSSVPTRHAGSHGWTRCANWDSGVAWPTTWA